MLEAIFKYQFMQNAIIACVLASLVCGIMGVIITQKKLVMMSSGIAHTAYGGVGLGYLLGFEPMIGGVIFSVAAALGIGFAKKRNIASDISIAMFWSLGMALGIVFIGMMPGYPPDLNSYLFGNILSVTSKDIKVMFIITLIVMVVFIIFLNDWKSFLFDSEFASMRGINTRLLEYILLVLVALTVITLIRVAGIILVLAMLTTPSATANLLSKRFKTRIILSIALGLVFCLCGIYLSYKYNIASGATIIIFSIIVYVSICIVKWIVIKKQSKLIKNKG